MTSNLLKCTICPKKPSFSDVSHLLTHIGSKGHLAHLHGLQVRSHQELDAGHALGIYNQWFQEHGVATLLSERMQQKQIRQEDKRAANKRRMAVTPSIGRVHQKQSSTALQEPPHVPVHGSQLPAIKARSSIEADDPDYAPSRATKRSCNTNLPSSPPRLSSYFAGEDDCQADDDFQTKASPDTPQLKGIQWPGMNLFDAAPEEARRKRNQKKDGSVLRGLERNAAMVEPTEVVHSATGEVLKHRHMDHLENDSPVEGEYEMPQPSPKKRKASAPRVKREAKEVKRIRKGSRKLGRPRTRQVDTPSKLPSSSVGDLARSISRFSPTKDENKEFSMPVRNMNRRKKNNNDFTVYQDSSPPFGGDAPSQMMNLAYVNANTRRPQLAYPPPVLLRQQPEAYDPSKFGRDRFPSYSTFGDFEQDKENLTALGTNISPQGNSMVNPLFFHSGTYPSSAGQLGSRLGPFVSHDMDPFNDTFMTVRNPLMAAFEHLETPMKHETFGFESTETTNFATQYRQPLFAP